MCRQRKVDQKMVNGSELEASPLTRLEAVIDKYRRDFYAVGKALKQIRDGRHYRDLSVGTFDRYVNVRWDMSRSHAYRLIEAFVVIENLSPIGDVLPKNEAQARPLTRLDPHSQRRAWRDFLKTHKPLCALNIKRFVSLVEHKSPPHQQAIQASRQPDAFSDRHCSERQVAIYDPAIRPILEQGDEREDTMGVV
jgi:hypothetical protein